MAVQGAQRPIQQQQGPRGSRQSTFGGLRLGMCGFFRYSPSAGMALQGVGVGGPVKVGEVDAGSSAEVDAGSSAEVDAGSSAEVDAGSSVEVGAGSSAEVGAGSSAEVDTGTLSRCLCVCVCLCVCLWVFVCVMVHLPGRGRRAGCPVAL